MADKTYIGNFYNGSKHVTTASWLLDERSRVVFIYIYININEYEKKKNVYRICM